MPFFTRKVCRIPALNKVTEVVVVVVGVGWLLKATHVALPFNVPTTGGRKNATLPAPTSLCEVVDQRLRRDIVNLQPMSACAHPSVVREGWEVEQPSGL